MLNFNLNDNTFLIEEIEKVFLKKDNCLGISVMWGHLVLIYQSEACFCISNS